MRHLIRLARLHLGHDVVLYTTDFGNLENMRRGSFNGSEVGTHKQGIFYIHFFLGHAATTR